MNSNFGLVRLAKGIRSGKRRGKKRSPQTHYETRTYSNNDLVSLPAEPDMPQALVLYHFGENKRATILTGEDPRTRPVVPNTCFKNMKVNDDNWLTFPGPLNPLWFFQFLAKTAYCLAIAAYGYQRFKPYLIDLIKKGDLTSAAMHIGILDDYMEVTPTILHVLDVDVVDAVAYTPLLAGTKKRLIIARINLFVNQWSHRTYEVVVGEFAGIS